MSQSLSMRSSRPRRRRARAVVALAAAALMTAAGLVAAAPATAASTTYYVDCSASTNGTGTQNAPWNSVTAAKPASGAFVAGDTVLLKAGTACTGSFVAVGSGSASAPIRLGSYGKGAKPIINGGGTVEAPVVIRNVSYWTVEGLEVTNVAAAEGKRSGVLIENTGNAVLRGIRVASLDVHDVTGQSNRTASDRYVSAGIQVRLPAKSSGLTGSFDGVTIEDNSVRDVRSMGIAVVGSPNGDDTINHNRNVVIRGNSVIRAAADSILIGVSIDPLVERNISYDAGYNASNRGAIAGIWAYTSANPVFQFNESARTQPGPDSMGWDCDWGITGSCTYQYNYSHENTGGFYLECLTCFGPGQTDVPKLTIRYNVSQGEGFINSAGGNVRLEMYNNTLYNPDRPFDVRLPAHSLVANNIFVGSGLTRFDTDRGITVDRNVYHGFSGPAADVDAINADPLFADPGTGRDGIDTVAGYKLRAGSPAIGAGRLIADNGGRDYWGNAVAATAAPTIGAYAGAPVTTPPPASPGVANGGFENGSAAWSLFGGATTGAAGAHSGTKALALSGYAGAEQTVTGLQPNTTYTLTGWAKAGSSSAPVSVGVKSFGGQETAQTVTATDYTRAVTTFTTGATSTSAVIYCYKPTGVTGYCDDLSVDGLLRNGGFESGRLSPWTSIWANDDDNFVVPQQQQGGRFAVQTSLNGHKGIEQTVALEPGATYTLSGWAKVAKAGEEVRIGVYSFGNPEQFVSVTSTSYTKVSTTFTVGAGSSSAKVYCLKETGLDIGFCDSLALTRVG
ncbi:Carbohydrate binding domain protein [Microbacterium oxydans]|uniref:Carbohydrate binding domain protein n=1 Tax=Microbacterium oxydans TaxID=82380 RepID=A0A0F0L3A6_9MICO|nr:carbohydrate binding domain-containing protein [Microbacterium oxydans]KJL26840.1 Carbohydrate binding domain protein [Microbacterium oxydans]